uniref:Uncharacterized protein n=1 Tax=Arundo donax TaxID=35708 RepID=A0A0A8ZI24_ARUDO
MVQLKIKVVLGIVVVTKHFLVLALPHWWIRSLCANTNLGRKRCP